MNIKSRLLVELFLNEVGYTTGMKDYLKEQLKKDKLSYEQLKYLYLNLYTKTAYIQQNIKPVCEFLMKGYSTNEAERLANMLPDAKGQTIFSIGGEGELYNKLFTDLTFVYTRYDGYMKELKSSDTAFEKTKKEFKDMAINRQNEEEMEM